MPRLVRTTLSAAELKIAAADHGALALALYEIAASALDDSDSGADTAAVVYEQLARLGIIVP